MKIKILLLFLVSVIIAANTSVGLFAAASKGPAVTVKKTSVKAGMLYASLTVSKEASKVETYVDGKLRGPVVTSKFDDFAIDICDTGKGKRVVKFITYDKSQNKTINTVSVNNDVDKKPYASDGSYNAIKAAKAPAIDGNGNDACWKNAPWRDIKYLWLFTQPSEKDFSGRYKIVWTPEKLYYLVEITDDILNDDHPDPLVDYYKDDCLELFIDENRSGGVHTYNNNAFAYHIGLDYKVADIKEDGGSRLDTQAIKEVKRTKKGNVYTWEVAVSVFDDKFKNSSNNNKPVKLSEGKTLGFAIAYCDNDGNYDREHFMGTVYIPGKDKNMAWMDASYFGPLKLINK